MSDITIKRVNPKTHSAELYDFQAEFFPTDHVLAVEAGGDWWIAYDDDDAIGFAGLSPSSRWADWGYLCRVGVRKSHQGRGLQKRFIRVRVARARAHGWTGVLTDTTENPASANSLIRCGFQIYQPADPYCYANTIYFRKRLL